MTRAALLGAVLLLPAVLAAQPSPGRLPNPYLFDSPWGDFPLSRLQPGARLRLTTADGSRTKARLVSSGDTVIQLRARARTELRTLTLAELRALRALEVRAFPVGRKRATTIAAVTGVVAGAILGASGYRGRSAKFADESWSGYVVARASVGGLLGLAVGHYVIGRARWRPVIIP